MSDEITVDRRKFTGEDIMNWQAFRKAREEGIRMVAEYNKEILHEKRWGQNAGKVERVYILEAKQRVVQLGVSRARELMQEIENKYK